MKDKTASVIENLLGVVVAISTVVASPFLLIWLLNTLFLLPVPYTFQTWLASALVGISSLPFWVNLLDKTKE